MSILASYARIVAKSRKPNSRSFETFTLHARVSPTAAWRRAYANSTELPVEDTALPITALQVLAGPLHLRLLADARVPRAALGLVHMRNVFERVLPLDANGSWELAATLTPVHASSGVLHGVTLTTEAHAGGALAWRSCIDAIWPGKSHAPRAQVQNAPSGPCTMHAVRVPADVGRVYARASGDFNPIHLHAASARAFGMRTAIAHGMWTVARLLAAFGAQHAARVEANFYKPLRLPSQVEMRREPGSQALWCVSGGGEHVHLGLLLG